VATGKVIKYAFTPEQVQVIHRAYDLTCAALGLSGAADRMTEVVVRKIIELARTGELNAESLSRWALTQLQADTPGRRMIEEGERLKLLAEQCVTIAEHTADMATAAELLKISLRLIQFACPELVREGGDTFEKDLQGLDCELLH
jgi:hypothetical protein